MSLNTVSLHWEINLLLDPEYVNIWAWETEGKNAVDVRTLEAVGQFSSDDTCMQHCSPR